MAETARGRLIGGLALAGLADALYMLAYQRGLIRRLACPFFGDGCARVARSPHARHFGVPNALVGALGYATMGSLALAAGDRPPEERPLAPLALGGLAAAAVAVSAYLTWEQPTKVGAWCFWCLSSAVLNVGIFAASLPGARRAFSAWLRA